MRETAEPHRRSEPGSGTPPTTTVPAAVVGILERTTGKAPSRAQAVMEADSLSVLLQDTLTTAERTLRDGGQAKLVHETRLRLHDLMRDDLVATVERHTGREVTAFMADSHLEPDLAVHIYILGRTLAR